MGTRGGSAGAPACASGGGQRLRLQVGSRPLAGCAPHAGADIGRTAPRLGTGREVDRRPAIRESQHGSRERVLRRRPDRRGDLGSLPDRRLARHVEDIGDDLQGHEPGCRRDRAGARRPLHPRGQRPPRRRSAQDHGAPDRRRGRHAAVDRHLGRIARRCLCDAGAAGARHRRRAAGSPDRRGGSAAGVAADRQPACLRVLRARPPGGVALAAGRHRPCDSAAAQRPCPRRRQRPPLRGAGPCLAAVPGGGDRRHRRADRGGRGVRAQDLLA